jgi:nitrate reductase NapE component
VASFWFAVFGLVGILDRIALGEVGFYGVAVWLGVCILGRAGENEVVVAEVVGSDGAEVGLARAKA